MLGDKLDGVLAGEELLGHVVGDLQHKFLLKRHHQFYSVQRVQSEVVHKVGLELDLVRVYLGEVLQHVKHAASNVVHGQKRVLSGGEAAKQNGPERGGRLLLSDGLGGEPGERALACVGRA